MRKFPVAAAAILTVAAAALALPVLGVPAAKADSAAALKALDPDNDGTIDLAEAQKGGEAVFAKLDADKSGTLTPKELKGRLSKKGMGKADPDKDGSLDKAEYAKMIEKRFKGANPDKDNTIDAKELDSKPGQALLRLIN